MSSHHHHYHHFFMIAWISLTLCLSLSLSPSFPIIPRSQYVFQTTSCVRTELLLVSCCWSANTDQSIWRSPWENIIYEFFLASPTVSLMSGSFYLDGFRDGSKWPCSCCFVGCCFQDLFNKARNISMQFPSIFFSMRLVSLNVVHPYNSIDIPTV